jgi:hypothetical protein
VPLLETIAVCRHHFFLRFLAGNDLNALPLRAWRLALAIEI